MRKEVKRACDANSLVKFMVDLVTGKPETSLEVGPINEFALGIERGKAMGREAEKIGKRLPKRR